MLLFSNSADEIPGLLVTQKLINILDEAAALGQIQEKIQVVSFANPLGLSQFTLGSHIGRFSLESGINFNRDWPNVSASVVKRIAGKLKENNTDFNVRLIRQSILEAVAEENISVKLDQVLKRELYKMAACADVFLDLHCDSGMYSYNNSHTHILVILTHNYHLLLCNCYTYFYFYSIGSAYVYA